jgi:hypothetical protein
MLFAPLSKRANPRTLGPSGPSVDWDEGEAAAAGIVLGSLLGLLLWAGLGTLLVSLAR